MRTLKMLSLTCVLALACGEHPDVELPVNPVAKGPNAPAEEWFRFTDRIVSGVVAIDNDRFWNWPDEDVAERSSADGALISRHTLRQQEAMFTLLDAGTEAGSRSLLVRAYTWDGVHTPGDALFRIQPGQDKEWLAPLGSRTCRLMGWRTHPTGSALWRNDCNGDVDIQGLLAAGGGQPWAVDIRSNDWAYPIGMNDAAFGQDGSIFVVAQVKGAFWWHGEAHGDSGAVSHWWLFRYGADGSPLDAQSLQVVLAPAGRVTAVGATADGTIVLEQLDPQMERRLMALDAATAKPLWTHMVALPSVTPTLLEDGSILRVVGEERPCALSLQRVDLEGRVREVPLAELRARADQRDEVCALNDVEVLGDDLVLAGRVGEYDGFLQRRPLPRLP